MTTARLALRAATEPHHARVDRVFSHADLTDREAYGRFLMAQAEAHLPVEQALTTAGAASILPDWPDRLRADALRADLADLALAAPHQVAAPVFDRPAAVLGGIYVLEGSRLGGRLLQRSVPAHFPTRFLGAGNSAAWRLLLEVLDTHLTAEEDRQRAIAAAAETFLLFERSGQRFLGVR